ncbi:MAG TPA: DUF502 domain-containing protein [Candidatus Omnitrophica bacterium]|nr:DUF502 domain-containing protein [Candidatus Omnitrophota bacterium]
MKEITGKIAREIRTDFITGFLVVFPIIITIWLVWFLFSKLVDFSVWILPYRLEEYLAQIKVAKAFWAIFVVFVGILAITTVGIFARNVLGRKLISFGEGLIRRIPVVKWIYETVQKISQAFLGQGFRVFQKVVLFEYPRTGSYAVGFVTSRIEKGIVGKDTQPYVNIFIPTTPNPTSGFLIILPEKDTIPLNISTEEAMRFIVSVGAIPPDSGLLKK